MEIVPSRAGAPTLVHEGVHLDDPIDPVEGARLFAPAERVEGAKLVVVFGAGLGYRVRRLAELGVEKIVAFEPSEEALQLARAHDTGAFEPARVFTDTAPLLGHLLEATFAGDKTVLLASTAHRRLFPGAYDELVATLREAESLKQLKRNTVVERFGLVLETGLANLPRLAHIPQFTELGRPLQGCPAFVVAAGPSLDANGHLLQEAATKGAIFTVNTASPCVVAHGASIDVLTCIESLDVTESLARAAQHARIVALDLTSHAANFDVQAAARVAFMPRTDPFRSFAQLAGGAALPYGASVATAAFALALHWGADPIVLVGQDLAYTGGRVYAKHTGREHMRAVVNGPAVSIEWPQQMLDAFRSGGVTEPGKHRPKVMLPAWGGEGQVVSTHDMLLFKRWFEAAAHELGGARTLVDATEGGASIAGFRERPLAELLAELGPRRDGLAQAMASAQGLGVERLDRIRDDIGRGARTIARAASACLAARTNTKMRKADRLLLEARKSSQFVEVHCTPALIQLREQTDVPAAERRRRTFAAIRDSARRVAELVRAA